MELPLPILNDLEKVV